MRRHVSRLFDACDALVLPTLPIAAPPIGQADIQVEPSQSGLLPVRAVMLKHTQLFNLTGNPAITLPLKSDGLPVGLQLVGRLGQTEQLLALAAACERVLGMNARMLSA
jgi:Asp-tRNA(Asn)/Glu-tRNA(Gln) amidotransferase A subunit family amidase